MSYSESKNDLTQNLGENSSKNNEELSLSIYQALHDQETSSIYEIVEIYPTIWKVRRKLCLQSCCR